MTSTEPSSKVTSAFPKNKTNFLEGGLATFKQNLSCILETVSNSKDPCTPVRNTCMKGKRERERERVLTWYADVAGLEVGLEVLGAGLRHGVQGPNHHLAGLSARALRVKVVQDVRVAAQRVAVVICSGEKNLTMYPTFPLLSKGLFTPRLSALCVACCVARWPTRVAFVQMGQRRKNATFVFLRWHISPMIHVNFAALAQRKKHNAASQSTTRWCEKS